MTSLNIEEKKWSIEKKENGARKFWKLASCEKRTAASNMRKNSIKHGHVIACAYEMQMKIDKCQIESS